MNILEQFISSTNTILWSYILIAMLIGLGLYFSIKLKFITNYSFREMVRLMSDGLTGKTRKKVVYLLSKRFV